MYIKIVKQSLAADISAWYTTRIALFSDDICGFCHTRLYAVEQEINGLYPYARNLKLDINIIKEINEQKAAIED